MCMHVVQSYYFINNECEIYINTLDFTLISYVTKIGQFHVS